MDHILSTEDQGAQVMYAWKIVHGHACWYFNISHPYTIHTLEEHLLIPVKKGDNVTGMVFA